MIQPGIHPQQNARKYFIDVNRLKWVVGIMASGLAAAAYWVKDHLPFLKGGG
ncbi:protein of unknown function [Nitrospina watsonii]|uniref:Uncharacterized protein n=1 Tax=Nitrospina watsonii TaxID=1323948 RepID=A0ABM9HFX5_9BACT|nr:protein of unknown function [Nitrospina watsonii]